jgi:Tfp pilus assembly protein PilV
MLDLERNTKGLTLVETIMAVFLVSISIMALLSLQPTAWKMARQSDYMGRAAGILTQEMERMQALIMNPCTDPLPASDASPRSVQTSGESLKKDGDAIFLVKTTIDTLTAGKVWRITVHVTWPPISKKGISENIVVTRQDRYEFPKGCP